jgi:hypothetical protein
MKRTGLQLLTVLFVFLFFLSPLCPASAEADREDTAMLDNLRKMRLKQQHEEIVIRETRFVHLDKEHHCTPVQQTRQRIRDVEAASGKTAYENININAGHDELNVTDNHGTINSDVNVQVINQGSGRECL